MSNRRDHLFIIRMWCERYAPGDRWRGSVHHVASGRRIVSANLDEIADFVAIRLHADGGESDSPRETKDYD